MEYSDRYGGQGGPDTLEMCEGQCEGTGFYPEWTGPRDEEGRIIIDADVEGEWELITCPECRGTGRKET